MSTAESTHQHPHMNMNSSRLSRTFIYLPSYIFKSQKITEVVLLGA